MFNAAHEEELQQLNIKYILNAAIQVRPIFNYNLHHKCTNWFPDSIEYHQVNVHDNERISIAKHFPECFEFLGNLY